MRNNFDFASLLSQDLNIDCHTFQDLVVVVTGAGRGIGLFTARAFALLGARTILAELSDAGRNAERIVREEGGDAHLPRLMSATRDQSGTWLVN